jgi:hypothetical protein
MVALLEVLKSCDFSYGLGNKLLKEGKFYAKIRLGGRRVWAALSLSKGGFFRT